MTCVHIIPPGLTDESRRSADIDTIIYFVVSLLASISGAICGIGGGVIIKNPCWISCRRIVLLQ